MKANEFVKEFGLERSKKAIEMSAGDFSRAFDIDKGFIIVRRGELKRLVESWELVKEFYTIERAKEYANSIYTAPEVSERLKQAILDVESCQ